MSNGQQYACDQHEAINQLKKSEKTLLLKLRTAENNIKGVISKISNLTSD